MSVDLDLVRARAEAYGKLWALTDEECRLEHELLEIEQILQRLEKLYELRSQTKNRLKEARSQFARWFGDDELKMFDDHWKDTHS